MTPDAERADVWYNGEQAQETCSNEHVPCVYARVNLDEKEAEDRLMRASHPRTLARTTDGDHFAIDAEDVVVGEIARVVRRDSQSDTRRRGSVY